MMMMTIPGLLRLKIMMEYFMRSIWSLDRLLLYEHLLYSRYYNFYFHQIILHSRTISRVQMLFYESAACLHGRRQVLRGKYYASVFTHYQPTDPAVWNFNVEVCLSVHSIYSVLLTAELILFVVCFLFIHSFFLVLYLLFICC